MKSLAVLTVVLTALLAACAPVPSPAVGDATPIVMTAEVSTVIAEPQGTPGTAAPLPTPEPPTAIPPLPASSLSPTELKYKILDQFPDFFFCDPDLYPIAREDEAALAQQRFPELQDSREEFQAILSHNGLGGLTTFTPEQKLLIYREHKKLAAIHFELTGEKYQFQIQTGVEGQSGFVVTGTIDGGGAVTVLERDPGFPACPICLAAGTLIDTPRGPVSVEELRVGDQVWTANEAGVRVAAVILAVGSVQVPASHQMIHVILEDGRELWASPGHPLVDGKRLADLKVGDTLGGARVTLIERQPYAGTRTYDLLPSGDTGFYWANGILVGSSLKKP